MVREFPEPYITAEKSNKPLFENIVARGKEFQRQVVHVQSANTVADKALKRLIKMTNYTGRN